MEAFVGIDGACAKQKYLPICVGTASGGSFTPLTLRTNNRCLPPRGLGNRLFLNQHNVDDFARQTAAYLRKLEGAHNVAIKRIAIDAPWRCSSDGKRHAEIALDEWGLRGKYIKPPSCQQLESKRIEALKYCADRSSDTCMPAANLIWMFVGFALFEVLSAENEWECLEVFPYATIAALGCNQLSKRTKEGRALHLSEISRRAAAGAHDLTLKELHRFAYGASHDVLDAYSAAWIESLPASDRVPLGKPPYDAIWIPKDHCLKRD